MPEQTPPTLWTPGDSLAEHFAPPSQSELVSHWETFTQTTAYPLKEVFGAYIKPQDPVAVASVDFCEVVRETSQCFNEAISSQPEHMGLYGEGSWFKPDQQEDDFAISLIATVAKVILNADLVRPVPNIDSIRTYLQIWRAQGVYVVGNTSTLEGSELPTIRFLQTYMPSCFDALLLPRNHDGSGKTTKARALDILFNEAGIPGRQLPLVHIDDLSHHIASFATHFKEHGQTAYFKPRHHNRSATAQPEQCDTSLEAFQRTHQFFRQQGVVA